MVVVFAPHPGVLIFASPRGAMLSYKQEYNFNPPPKRAIIIILIRHHNRGVRGPLKIIADGVVRGKMIMSARLISAGPRPGYTPIFHDSLCPKGPPRVRSGGRPWRLVPSPRFAKRLLSRLARVQPRSQVTRDRLARAPLCSQVARYRLARAQPCSQVARDRPARVQPSFQVTRDRLAQA